VGIVANHDMVIHACREFGVVIDPLKKFLASLKLYILKEVRDKDVAKRGCLNAYQQIGRPYNLSYYPETAGLYCSELVTECYLSPDGNRYFQLEPMSFIGASESYWDNYYKKLGLAVPHGVLGSHPQKLFLQKEKYL
jgi:hypothetical protein